MLFLGGYFGLGWTRDIWRIPEYVRDANDEPDHLRKLTEKMRKSDKPPFSVNYLVVGCFWLNQCSGSQPFRLSVPLKSFFKLEGPT